MLTSIEMFVYIACFQVAEEDPALQSRLVSRHVAGIPYCRKSQNDQRAEGETSGGTDVPRNHNIGTWSPYSVIGGIRDSWAVIPAGGQALIPMSFSSIRSLTWHTGTSRRSEAQEKESEGGTEDF